MRKSHVIRQVSEESWNDAQRFEERHATEMGGIASGDDWNRWWFDKFEGYRAIEGQSFDNVLEVGCGPHTNLRYILPHIQCKRIFLEDPLIQTYVAHLLDLDDAIQGKSRYDPVRLFRVVRHACRKKDSLAPVLQIFLDSDHRIDLSSARLEDLPYKDEYMDLIVCINVLDHVNDYDMCMQEMHRVLKPGGSLVIGQDLSDEIDMKCSPESYTDVGHPIKVDLPTIEESLCMYKPIYRIVLGRAEGRNPSAHYATFLGVFLKGKDPSC